VLTVRGIACSSSELGVSGQCDVLELHRIDGDSENEDTRANGIPIADCEGLWIPFPIEFKKGVSKNTDADRLQLCCQAMCLEEMLCTDVPKGALFYGESRRREEVIFTPALRDQVRSYLAEMHQYYERGYTPKVKATKSCNACSLKDLCLPRLMKTRKVSEYIKNALREEVEECGDKKDAEDIVVEISE
jgi:CRISPR-associated exonuclease Cas4